MNVNRQPATGLLLGMLLLVTACFYYQGAMGPYVMDDIPNLVENPSLALKDLQFDSLREAAFSSPASRFYRPLAMLSFAVNYTLAGDNAEFSIKITNILLHLLNGLGVYLLIVGVLTRFLNQAFIPRDAYSLRITALLVTGIWLLHPLYVSTVLYSIQRMAILSNLFMIFGCLGYLKLRIRLLEDGRGLPALIAMSTLCTLLAFLSKENGALLPGCLLLIEIFCFNLRFHPEAHPQSRLILGAFLGFPMAAVGGYLLSIFLLHAGKPLTPYSFTPWERLLTEARVLWSYAGWLTFLNPLPMGIYHDDLTVSKGLTEPWSTLPAAVGWLIVVVLTVRLSLRRHVIAFGLLWFLWGHSLESTVLPLAPMFEHRNYQPGPGLLLSFVLLIRDASGALRVNNGLKTLLCIILFLLLPLYTLKDRVADWGDRKSLTLALLRDKPYSAQSMIMAAKFLAEGGDHENALLAARQAQLLDPNEPSHVMAEAIVHCNANRSARFSAGLEERLRGLRVTGFVSVNTLRQLRQMIPVCQSSQLNEDALLALYDHLGKHADDHLAMLGMYGSGTIHMQQRKYVEVVHDWEAAMARHTDAAGLKPALEWARRQIRQQDE